MGQWSRLGAFGILLAAASLAVTGKALAEPPKADTIPPAPFDEATIAPEPPPEEPDAPETMEGEDPFKALDLAFGLGYFHPVGAVGERHGHGTIIDVRLRLFVDRLIFGLDIKLMSSASTDEEIVVPADFEGNDEPMKLGSSPSAWVMGPSLHFAFVHTDSFLMSLGTAVYFLREKVEFDEEKDEHGDDGKYAGLFQEYRRLRRGVATSLQLDLAYHWVFGDRLGVGPYLSLGAVGGWTWGTDEVHPDLGTTDDADYGFEIWPFALLGIRAFIIESVTERAAAREAGDDVKPWFYRTLFGLGYSHPLGDISRAYPAGLEIDAHMLLRLRWLELGLDMAIRVSTDESDRVLLAADSPDNPHTRVWEMSCDPQSFSFGLVFNPLVIDRGPIALTAGIRLGYAQHMIGRGEDVKALDGKKYSFDDYRRLRRGIVIGERVDLAWLFMRQGTSSLGLAILARLDEIFTWPDGTRQADTGKTDTGDYGLELWPSISLALVASL